MKELVNELMEERKNFMLELKHVKKSYDHVTILEDINLKIQDGKLYPY